jgi:hypothetical protein
VWWCAWRSLRAFVGKIHASCPAQPSRLAPHWRSETLSSASAARSVPWCTCLISWRAPELAVKGGLCFENVAAMPWCWRCRANTCLEKDEKEQRTHKNWRAFDHEGRDRGPHRKIAAQQACSLALCEGCVNNVKERLHCCTSRDHLFTQSRGPGRGVQQQGAHLHSTQQMRLLGRLHMCGRGECRRQPSHVCHCSPTLHRPHISTLLLIASVTSQAGGCAPGEIQRAAQHE